MSFCCFFFLLLPSHLYFSFLFSSPFLVLPPYISVLQTFRLLLFLFLKHGEGIMLCGDPMSPTMSPTSFFFLSFSWSLLLSHPDLFSYSLVSPFFFPFSPVLLCFFLSSFYLFFFLLFAIILTPLLKTRFLAPQKKLQLPPCFNVLSIKTWECGSHHVCFLIFFNSIFFIFFLYIFDFFIFF